MHDRDTDPYAMAYYDKDKGFYFIPTNPEGRRWRGPYETRKGMLEIIQCELGEDVTVTWTTVAGRLR